jgi:hypothetical protein
MAWNHGLCRAVLGVYARVRLDVYTRGGRTRDVPGGRTGTVTVMQIPSWHQTSAFARSLREAAGIFSPA